MRLIIKKIILKLNKILQKHNLRIIVEDIKKPITLDDLTKNEIKRVKKILNLTMVSSSNLTFLLSAINYIKKNKIHGDYAETGVWKGGVSILSYLTFSEKFKMKKNFYLYDTFEGMSNPEKVDETFKGESSIDLLNKLSKKKVDRKKNILIADCSIEDVKKNFKKFSNKNNLICIKGPVEKTLDIKENLPNKISILRLDTDWYSSTKKELEILFPLLEKNGILIIDDYGFWKGARKAVDEYFKNKNVTMFKIDFTGRMIINSM